MSEAIRFVGLDVHAARTAAAAVELGSGVVGQQRIVGPPVAAVEWLAGLAGVVRAVYEAGPTGFGLARAAPVARDRDHGLLARRDRLPTGRSGQDRRA